MGRINKTCFTKMIETSRVVRVAPTGSPTQALYRAASDVGLHGIARLFFALRPNVQAVTERMAGYITEHVPHPSGDPLVHVLLRHAFGDMADCKAALMPVDETDLQVAFYRGLFRSLPALTEVDVRAGEEVWDPFAGEPLTQWLRSHLPAVIQEVEPGEALGNLTPRAFRIAVAAYLFTSHDLAEIGGQFDRIMADT